MVCQGGMHKENATHDPPVVAWRTQSLYFFSKAPPPHHQHHNFIYWSRMLAEIGFPRLTETELLYRVCVLDGIMLEVFFFPPKLIEVDKGKGTLTGKT